MKRFGLPLLGLCLSLGAGQAMAEERIAVPGNGTPAPAEEPSSGIKLGPAFTLNPNITVLSDYVSRGISNNKHNPVIQGTLKITHDPSGLYASLFASNVRSILPPPPPQLEGPYMELDPAIGWSRELGGVNVDLGVVHYGYPGATKALKLYYDEYYLGLGRTFDNKLDLNAKYSYSPSFGGSLVSNSASYLDLSVGYMLPVDIRIGGHYGRSWGDFFDSVEGASIKHYNDYTLSLSKEIVGVNATLSWNTTDHRAKVWQSLAPNLVRDQVVLGLSKNF
ncbi:MAG: TorF family putative porin [Magnetococcus sp. YQC-9]